MDDLFLKGITFEGVIAYYINSMLSENETIVIEPKIDDRFRGDILLPEGCKKLKLSPKTLIEVKINLSYDNLKRIFVLYKQYLPKYEHFVIVCKECLFEMDEATLSKLFGIDTKIITFSSIVTLFRQQKEESRNKKDIPTEDPINMARDAFKNNQVSLFLGAGLSMDAKLPSWDKLLETLLERMDNKPFEYINDANSNAISSSLAHSAIVTGRYVIEGFRESIRKEKMMENKNISSELLEKEIDDKTNTLVVNRMRSVLYNKVKSSNLVNAVAKIASEKNVQQLITYNYDDLVEMKVSPKSRFVSVYDRIPPLLKGQKPIYHVHGYIPRNENNPGFPVLSEKEYHQLYSSMHHWANVVQLNALYSTSCFFIGFSMTDPNQRRLLDLANKREPGLEKVPHYVFLRKTKLAGEAIAEVNNEHFLEIEKMMLQLGLNVIWYNEYEQLPDILLYIAGKLSVKPDVV